MSIQQIARGDIIRTIQNYAKLQQRIEENEIGYKDYTLFGEVLDRFLDEVV